MAILSFARATDSAPTCLIICSLEPLLQNAPGLRLMLSARQDVNTSLDFRDISAPHASLVNLPAGLLVHEEWHRRWMWLACLAVCNGDPLDCENLNAALDLRKFASKIQCSVLFDAIDIEYGLGDRDPARFCALIRMYKNDS